jgi:hypothetical protein
VGTTEICGRHHRNLWQAPQKSVVGTTEICGGHHRNLWWAPQKSVVDSRRTEFSERKRKQVLSYGEKYLLNGRCYSVDTYMYEHMLHKVSIAESPNKGCNRVLLVCMQAIIVIVIVLAKWREEKYCEMAGSLHFRRLRSHTFY